MGSNPARGAILEREMSLSIEKVFPCVQIVLSIAACVVYFHTGDIRKGIYWLAAAVLTSAVTF